MTKSPSRAELVARLGRTHAAWTALVEFVQARYRVQAAWDADRDGWELRWRKGGKALLTLRTEERRFSAQFVVPPTRVREALALPLSPATRALIRAARPYPDGRWIRIPVRTLRDLADLKTLVVFKAAPGTVARRKTPAA